MEAALDRKDGDSISLEDRVKHLEVHMFICYIHYLCTRCALKIWHSIVYQMFIIVQLFLEKTFKVCCNYDRFLSLISYMSAWLIQLYQLIEYTLYTKSSLILFYHTVCTNVSVFYM